MSWRGSEASSGAVAWGLAGSPEQPWRGAMFWEGHWAPVASACSLETFVGILKEDGKSCCQTVYYEKHLKQMETSFKNLSEKQVWLMKWNVIFFKRNKKLNKIHHLDKNYILIWAQWIFFYQIGNPLHSCKKLYVTVILLYRKIMIILASWCFFRSLFLEKTHADFWLILPMVML